jgi:selenocysteine lyase/cysteine desulfurase
MTNIRSRFPALQSDVAYLDNAATTQICSAAIDAMTGRLRAGRANIGRGLYPMAEHSMIAYEESRKTVARFVDADPATTVFVKSVTEGLNAIAFGVRSLLNPGDEILVSPFEHHANLLPWRRIARERGAVVRTMPMTSDFMLDVDGAVAMMNEKTKIVATTMVSNVLGTVVPVAKLVEATKSFPPANGGVGGGCDPFIIVDAAQAAAHIPISMRSLGADAIVFGSHKCYGPAGIAAMALSLRLASNMEPMIVGGGMVDRVFSHPEHSEGSPMDIWREIPARFEGGSPNVEGAVGFAAALVAFPLLPEEGLGVVGLRSRIIEGLHVIAGITVLNPSDAVGIVSFIVDGAHPHDIADLLGRRGVCVRAGHHCAQPLVDRIAPSGGTVRVSLAVYSTNEEVDHFLAALREVLAFLK